MLLEESAIIIAFEQKIVALAIAMDEFTGELQIAQTGSKGVEYGFFAIRIPSTCL